MVTRVVTLATFPLADHLHSGCEWEKADVMTKAAEKGAKMAAILYGGKSAHAQWWTDQQHCAQAQFGG